jgi:hypothetical protein
MEFTISSPKGATDSVLKGLQSGTVQPPTTLTIKSIKPKIQEMSGKQGNSRISGLNALQKVTLSPNISRFSIKSEQESLIK